MTFEFKDISVHVHRHTPDEFVPLKILLSLDVLLIN